MAKKNKRSSKMPATLLGKGDFQFTGFRHGSGYTNTPDITFDFFPKLLSGTEIKVLDYIFRRSTLKDLDVSINQMLKGLVTKKGKRLDFGCGVKSKTTVIASVTKLEELGLLEITRRTGNDGRHLANTYSLKFSEKGLEKPSLLEQYLERNEEPTPDNFIFDGFLRPSFTPIPDEVFDIFPGLLSHRAYLVVRYICRHTFGYVDKYRGKLEDEISLSQMMHGIITRQSKRIDYGCGLKKKAAIVAGIKEAEALGIIVVTRNKDEKNQNATTTYGLKFQKEVKNAHEDTEITPSTKKELPLVQKRNYPYTKKGTTLVQEGNQQDTEEQNTEQQHKQDLTEPESVVVNFLRKQGFSKHVAKQLSEGRTISYVEEKADYLAFTLEKNSGSVPNPLGWLRRAIEEDYGQPSGYEPLKMRQKKAEAEKKQQQKAAKVKAKLERSQREKERLRKQKKESLVQLYREQYGTTEEDMMIWENLKESLSISPKYKTIVPTLEGLRFDSSNEKIAIGVMNKFMLQRVARPKLNKSLIWDIQKALGLRNVRIEFVLVEQLN